MAIPLLVPALMSAAASIGNGIFGAASARKQQRDQQRAIDKEKAEERAFFRRAYNEDATQRASNQRLLMRANEMNKKRALAAAGKKAVIGGTDASQAAVQQANAEAMGNAVSDIAARSDDKKDALAAQHRRTMSGLNRQSAEIKAQAEAAKRNAVAQAATGAVNTAASMIAAGATDAPKTGAAGGAKAPTAQNPLYRENISNAQAAREQAAQVAQHNKAVPDLPGVKLDDRREKDLDRMMKELWGAEGVQY